MANETLDKFGKFFIENSFNKGNKKLDQLINGELKTYTNLKKEIMKLNSKQLDVLKKCFVAMLDSSLHDLLFAFQEASDEDKGIKIIVDGKNIAELSDGLHGELYSNNGWYAKFGNYKGDPSEID